MSRRQLLGASVAQAALLAFSAGDCAAQAEAGAAVVATAEGSLRGIQGPKAVIFRGVRYAEPQSPANRFKPPIKLKPWQGIRDAIQNGAIAPQNIPQTNLSISAPLRSNDKWAEDCLTLNIFTPSTTDKKSRAVLVWIHGGGYAFGSGNLAPYDGTNLASFGDVVVVTVNHRLNAFGFLQLPASAGPEYAQSSNAGMLDLVEALRWIKSNISAFGGDPGNVTIFGESGGGGKVSILTAMPVAKGLFHKAIIQSGATLDVKSKEEASASAAKLVERLGVKQVSPGALSALAPERILAVERDMESQFAPVMDGAVIPGNPYDPAAPSVSADVPIMVGTNQTETTYLQGSDASLFALDQAGLRRRLTPLFGDRTDDVIGSYEKTHPRATPSQLYFIISTDAGMRRNAILLAERKAAQRRAPVYMYYLNWHTPVDGGKWQSPHLLDIPFVFRNLEQCVALIGQGDQQRELMERMSSAWVAFAKTGNPSNHKTGYWPNYDVAQRATMIFDGKSQAIFTPDEEDRVAIFGPRKPQRTGPPPE